MAGEDLTRNDLVLILRAAKRGLDAMNSQASGPGGRDFRLEGEIDDLEKALAKLKGVAHAR